MLINISIKLYILSNVALPSSRLGQSLFILPNIIEMHFERVGKNVNEIFHTDT